MCNDVFDKSCGMLCDPKAPWGLFSVGAARGPMGDSRLAAKLWDANGKHHGFLLSVR